MPEIILPDTYNKNLTCGNCDSSAGLKIPMGITVEKYAQDHDCPNCGCKLLNHKDCEYRHHTNTPMIYLPFSLRRE